MYQCISVAHLKEGTLDTVLEAAKILVEATRKEPGLIYYNVVLSDDNPDTIIMVEKWEEKSNFIAHVQGAPCAAFGKVIDPNCAEPSIINAGEMII